MSLSLILYRLQQIDSQSDRIQARLEEIRKLLSDQRRLLKAEQEFQQAEELFLEEQRNLRRAEEAVKDQNTKIEQSESMLYSGKIRNPKELQDLQNEVAALNRYLAVLEDRQIETMFMVEEAEGGYAAAKQELEEVRIQVAGEQERFKEEEAKLLFELERLEIERQATTSAIPQESLQLYDQLRKTRSGIAVSRLSENACSACGSTLTPAMVQMANSHSQIARCPSCSRILYSA